MNQVRGKYNSLSLPDAGPFRGGKQRQSLRSHPPEIKNYNLARYPVTVSPCSLLLSYCVASKEKERA